LNDGFDCTEGVIVDRRLIDGDAVLDLNEDRPTLDGKRVLDDGKLEVDNGIDPERPWLVSNLRPVSKL
jgi:hypothetical protein